MAVSERLQLAAPGEEPADDGAGTTGDDSPRDETSDVEVVASKYRGWTPRIIGLCLLAYAVVAVVVFLPANPLSSTSVPVVPTGNPSWQDPFQMMWFLAYVPYALTHGASLFHTTLIDYPGGINLADNTWVPVLALLGWPITATLGPVAAFNLLLRLAFFASAGGMFLVLRRWCSSWQGPFLAGLLYAVSPYMTAQELHLDLNMIPIPPLLLLLGDEMVRRQKMRPITLGALIGGAAALEYLLSPDVLSGCGVMVLIIAAVLIVRFRDQLRDRMGYIWRAGLPALVVFAIITGYPIFEMLAGPGHLVGPIISVQRLQYDSADLLGAITPTSHERLVPSFLSSIGNGMVYGNLSENGTYLGIPLLVVLVLIVRRLRRDALIAVAALGAVVAFVFSLGSHLVVADWRSSIPMPGWVLSVLPVLDDTIPARYALYVVLFAAVILAVGIDRLWAERWARASSTDSAVPKPAGARDRVVALVRNPRTHLAGGAGLVVLTLLPAVPFASAALPWPSTLPAELTRLLPRGSEIATVPEASPQDGAPMAWQAIDGMSFGIMGGYANVQGSGASVGQKWPYPGEPGFLLGETEVSQFRFSLSPPIATPKPPPQTPVRSEFCSYIKQNNLAALVYTYPYISDEGLGNPTGAGILAALKALGPPTIIANGYAIWLTAGRCPSTAGVTSAHI
jgi:hypothetical protein